MLAHIPQNHPAVTIWTQPRHTLRQLIDQGPTRIVLVLAALHGFVSMIDRVSSRDAGDVMSLSTMLLMCMLIGPVAGLVSLYLGALLFRWVGRWLGGQGGTKELRTAMAWAGLPVIASLPLWGLLALLLGPALFTSTSTIEAIAPWQTIIATLVGLIILSLSGWSVLLSVLGIAEAHRFSIWRAIGTCLLPGVAAVVLLALIVIPLALFA